MTPSSKDTHSTADPAAIASAERLRARLTGPLLPPDSPGYDQARTIWNGMIDRRPSMVVQCESTADVRHAVDFAREEGVLLSVKGAGHNIGGLSLADGAMLVDLSGMRSVEVDAKRLRARVGPGCTLADFDAAAQAHGLATPLGINSTTGVAGLTLGGGFGWLSRKHGLSADNLLSAEVVTADGTLRLASATTEPDLFWAIRGGGGNFGVVTSFEFQLHPVGPEVLAGLIVHPWDDVAAVLRAWRDFTRDAPEEASVWVVLRKAPPLPFLPEEVHGRPVVVLAAYWAGDMASGMDGLAPIRAVGKPIADVIGPHPYAGWQQAFDPLLTPGARNYWKSHDFTALSDDFLDLAARQAVEAPSPHCEIFLVHLGGAVNRVPADATAYPARDTEYIMNVHGRWETAAEDEAGIAWARSTFDAMTPHASGSVYVNFMTREETSRVHSAYGPNYPRLAALKGRYDPHNLFRVNHNIAPQV